MKAQLSLPERPSALYLLAVLDVLVVLLIFFALIPVVAQQAGVPTKRLAFSSRLPTIHPEKKVLLTVRAGAQRHYRLEGTRIELGNLAETLGRLKDNEGIEVLMVVLDESLDVEALFEIEEVVRPTGLEVHFAGNFAVERAGLGGTTAPRPEEGGDEHDAEPNQ